MPQASLRHKDAPIKGNEWKSAYGVRMEGGTTVGLNHAIQQSARTVCVLPPACITGWRMAPAHGTSLTASPPGPI